VLCLDEVERLFPYPQVASEFLGLLRAWHEKSNVSEIWRRLRLVVVHSTEVYIPLNLNESPFNVGLAIDLPDFTPSQVHELSLRYKLNLSKEQIHSLMDLVGSYPDLIRLAFMTLKRDPSQRLEEVLAVASTEEGIYKGHLRHLWNLIQRSPDLVSVLVKVMFASEPLQLPSSPLTFQLMSLGVVDAVGNGIRPRYKLYQQYFQNLLKPLSVD
jgi:AAA-like domain